MIRPHYVPLYQGICHSEKMADLREKDARFFFCALLTYCDSYGRMDARPRTVHSKVWSMFGPPEAVPKLLADLERVGLIVRYEHEGQPVLAIPDWEEKAGRVGRPDRRGSESIPPPPRGTTPAECGTTPADLSVNDSSCGTTPASRARLDPIRAEPIREDTHTSSPPARPRKEPSGDHAILTKRFTDLFESTTGAKYKFSGGKDGKAVKELLKHFGGLEPTWAYVERWTKTPPDWIRGPVDLTFLNSQVNRLQPLNGHAHATVTRLGSADYLPELS